VFRAGIMMWRRGGGLATLGDDQLLASVDRAIRAVGPAKFHSQMKIEYSGHIPIALDEHAAVRDDLSLASLTCISLVLLVIYLYFRRFAVLLVIGAPAVLGLLLSLALARYTIHYLNANTAFLTSIILGNGINTPIILLARFGEERRNGIAVREALSTALAATLPATLTAMAAASIAYGSLLSTSLRGLQQFGLVGGAGMLLVWLMTFLLVPPLVIFGERLRPGLLTPRPNLWRRPFAALGRRVASAPLAAGVLVLAATAAALVPAWRYARDPLEYNFENLRTNDPEVARKWSVMYELGMGNVGAGHIARDGVVLVDDPAQADPVADALRKQDQAKGAKSVLETVRTLNQMLPSDQPAKLEILARIRSKIDRNLDRLDDPDGSERREAMAWRPPDTLHALTVPDLPHRIRENFTEVDGTIGRFVGIDADPGRYVEGDGRELIRLSRALEVDALGKHWVAAATSTVFAGMLETIVADGPRLMLLALVGVMLLVLASFGLRGAPMVLVPLAIGVAWLVALLGMERLKLNFVNFVAVPITLGVGVDYAANLWARLRREPGTSLGQVIADTGSAVALCSLTTIIGYSSLLLARNRALQSFGKVADLGEITCLCAALIALPSLVWLARRARGNAA
jgi:predicted RND superfamily exporter protein